MSYAFDPEIAPWLEMLPPVRLVDPASLAETRAQIAAEVTAMYPVYQPPRPVDVRDAAVPGPPGGPEVPVRVYTPAAGGASDLPGLVYFHGGGFVTGSIELFHPDTLRIAAEAGVVVVSVDYRLAPEHPFPAPLEDCYAALSWVAGNAPELRIDPARLGVAGESAGGCLAAAVTLLARDRGAPRLCFQYLAVPALDDRLDTPSMMSFQDTPLWNRPNAVYSWACYLGDAGPPGGPDVAAYAAPARTADLAGLPPAYVTVCEFDPVRDEGISYAQRLLHAGVSTELHHYPRTFHGWSMITAASITQRMLADQRGALRRGLGATTGAADPA
jgi:acetyl esterase